jgi:starch phosphorylase
MEYGLHECLPIYSGGLGVLAGDHLKTASDLGLPLVGVGLAYAEGTSARS